MPLVPALLAVHIVLALALLVPAIVLPFALRSMRISGDSAGPLVRGLLAVQGRGTLVVGVGLALSGSALVLAIGTGLLSQPWLIVALAIYAANLAVAFFIQRPSLRRLLGARSASDDGVWEARARRQRYVSYVLATLTGVIGFLMSTKPHLW